MPLTHRGKDRVYPNFDYYLSSQYCKLRPCIITCRVCVKLTILLFSYREWTSPRFQLLINCVVLTEKSVMQSYNTTTPSICEKAVINYDFDSKWPRTLDVEYKNLSFYLLVFWSVRSQLLKAELIEVQEESPQAQP